MTTDSDVLRNRKAKNITLLGLYTNLFLSILKFTVGYFGCSKAIIADAVHSLSDMSTDFAILFGIRYWSAPADEDHPYGHRRIETIVTVIIGMILILVAVEIGADAILTIPEKHISQPHWIALVGAIFSIIIKEALYHYTLKTGISIKSPAITANAWHHRSDALSSVPALIAVAFAMINPRWAFIDHIGAIIVSLFVLKVGWNIMYPALSELSDRSAPQKDLEEIRRIALTVEGVKEIHAIRTRKHGNGIHIDLHMLVNGDIPVRTGHEISTTLKELLIKKGPDVIDAIIHLEPFE